MTRLFGMHVEIKHSATAISIGGLSGWGKCSIIIVHVLPCLPCSPGGRVWRTCHSGDRRAVPGLCNARPAQDVLRDRHQGRSVFVFGCVLPRFLSAQQLEVSSNGANGLVYMLLLHCIFYLKPLKSYLFFDPALNTGVQTRHVSVQLKFELKMGIHVNIVDPRVVYVSLKLSASTSQ